jgi:hypothetical protein
VRGVAAYFVQGRSIRIGKSSRSGLDVPAVPLMRLAWAAAC